LLLRVSLSLVRRHEGSLSSNNECSDDSDVGETEDNDGGGEVAEEEEDDGDDVDNDDK
jgi:hypothetical protein